MSESSAVPTRRGRLVARLKQHLLAVLSDAKPIWYVYRDGHYVTPSDEEMAAPVDAA
jgi:hypothetical protein